MRQWTQCLQTLLQEYENLSSVQVTEWRIFQLKYLFIILIIQNCLPGETNTQHLSTQNIR